MGSEACTGWGGQGALPGRLMPARTPRRRAANPHQVYVSPLSGLGSALLCAEDHAIEAAVEAASAKDRPTLPHVPVEAAVEAADAEDRLTLHSRLSRLSRQPTRRHS